MINTPNGRAIFRWFNSILLFDARKTKTSKEGRSESRWSAWSLQKGCPHL